MTTPSEIDLFMNPEAHGYMECPHCNGFGSSLKEASARCTRCNGLGLVKKEEPSPDRIPLPHTACPA
jgi:DnaJ-class molecular chaperone